MTIKKNRTAPHHHSSIFCDDEFGCYREDFFLELLVFERKRSERSRNPFVVMTIDVSRFREHKMKKTAVREILDALTTLVRETDIRGWYKDGHVLGVLFAEMNRAALDVLQKKVNGVLHSSLSPAKFAYIRCAFHVFPEHGKPVQPGSASLFTFYPDLPGKERSKKKSLKVKRIMDIAGGIAGILLFSPFFILIPIVVKLTSRGPALFRQERVGQYEKRFLFLKFRSMHVNNDDSVHRQYVYDLIAKKVDGDEPDASGKKVFKITNDKRVTAIGKILRKTSLDELPQFFNVLQGEMSLVGPRPPIPYELEKYDAWHRRRVLEVKPGITGLWQVIGRSSTTFDEMVRLDLQYAANWSLWLDLKILFQTPFSMIGRGAY